MGGLSAQRVLQVWERGDGADRQERALLLLAAARPEEPRERLAALPLGVREAELLALRRQTLGPKLKGRTVCPRCGARLQFQLDAQGLLPEPAGQEDVVAALAAPGLTVTFRVPSTADLAAAAACPDVPAARRLLLERCVLGCRDKGGHEVTVDELAEEVVEALGEAMLSRDPGAELRVGLDCADCGHAWEVFFDVADFFWRELAALAQRLTAEVADLAQAYGWSEGDILAMGSARRKLYMESIRR